MVFLLSYSAHHEEQHGIGTLAQVLYGYQKSNGSLQWSLEIFLDLSGWTTVKFIRYHTKHVLYNATKLLLLMS